MKIKTKDGVVTVTFDAEEQECTATLNGFSGSAKTQERAVSLCLALRRDTLAGEDDETN